MAGMFDFKNAEQILAERQEKTRQNTLGLIKSSQEGMKSSEKAASNLGAMLTNLVISQFGGKSDAELLTDVRDMSETTQVMEQTGVGGEGSAQFDGKGSSYGAGVIQQARAAEKGMLDLLPDEMKQSERVRIGMERTPEDLDLVGRYRYMAGVLQDAGMTSRAAQAALLADKEVQRQKEVAAEFGFDFGGGTGATTPAATSEDKPQVPTKEGSIFNLNGVPHVVLNGKPVPVSQVEALKDSGITAEQGVLGKLGDALWSPFQGVIDASQRVEDQSDITIVKNAFERNSFSAEHDKAVKRVLEMPPEKTGLTDKQYEILGGIAGGGLKIGGK